MKKVIAILTGRQVQLVQTANAAALAAQKEATYQQERLASAQEVIQMASVNLLSVVEAVTGDPDPSTLVVNFETREATREVEDGGEQDGDGDDPGDDETPQLSDTVLAGLHLDGSEDDENKDLE